MRRYTCLLLMLGTVGFLAACSGDGDLDQPLGPDLAFAPTDTLDLGFLDPVVTGEPDRTFLEIAQEHPEFGGYYFENDRVQILSKSGVLPAGFEVPRSRTGDQLAHDVRSADWSFDELARWRGAFVEAIRGLEWYTLDIDERRNRIAATVAEVENVQRALEAAGIPPSVYIVEEGQPARLLTGSVSTESEASHEVDRGLMSLPCPSLTATCRPVIGGVQFGFTNGTEGGTLGFNVIHWKYGASVLTVAHATFSEGAVDGTVLTQNAPGSAIATEVWDRPLVHHTELPQGYCPDEWVGQT